ncbi:MAG: hypothetical protein NW208_08775 [Bryobacter sp.]|nr:hypothetical protein [Bryobacter sp.]
MERFQFTNDLSRLVLLCILKEEAEGFCLATYNTATKELIATVKGPELQDGCSEMSLSPDAQRVALTFARRGVIRIIENGVKVQEWQGRRSQLSPRGDRIAYLNPDNQVVIRVLATGKESIIARALACSSLYWSPDEQFLLHSTRLRFGIMGVTLLMVDANTGSEIWSKNISAPTCGGNYFLRSRPLV